MAAVSLHTPPAVANALVRAAAAAVLRAREVSRAMRIATRQDQRALVPTRHRCLLLRVSIRVDRHRSAAHVGAELRGEQSALHSPEHALLLVSHSLRRLEARQSIRECGERGENLIVSLPALASGSIVDDCGCGRRTRWQTVPSRGLRDTPGVFVVGSVVAAIVVITC